MPELVCIHGSGYTDDSFRAQVQTFERCDAVSLPGHPKGEALTSVAAMASWLSSYLRWKGPGEYVLAGNSLGGAIAMQLALQAPEQVAGLVLLATGARLRVSADIFAAIDRDWLKAVDQLVDLALGPQAPPELRERAKAWHMLVGRQTTRTDYAACNEFDVMDRLGEIQTPTLVVVGSHDRMTPPKYAHFLHDRIAGSELLVIEDAGHLAHAEKPEPVNEAIRRKFALP